MRLDLYKKDFDTIPTYTSLVLLIFERISTFHKQAYALSGSDSPYHFVGFLPHSASHIPEGTFSTFGFTLSHRQIIYFYSADASARISSDTASTCIASKQLYFRTKVIECFVKLYYKTKENYTLNLNNL